jgi:hypothetical protein
MFSLFRFLLEEVSFFHGLSPAFPEIVNSLRSIPYLDRVSIPPEDSSMAKRKRRPEKFSVVKAVKANARDRVGQPRPERVIDDQKSGRKPKHRQTMPQLLSGE